jgi:hypothetical protein
MTNAAVSVASLQASLDIKYLASNTIFTANQQHFDVSCPVPSIPGFSPNTPFSAAGSEI